MVFLGEELQKKRFKSSRREEIRGPQRKTAGGGKMEKTNPEIWRGDFRFPREFKKPGELGREKIIPNGGKQGLGGYREAEREKSKGKK